MTRQGPDFAEDIAKLHERGELELLRAALAKSEAEIIDLRAALAEANNGGLKAAYQAQQCGGKLIACLVALQAADAYAAGVEEMRNGGIDIATMDDLRANWIACRAKVPA